MLEFSLAFLAFWQRQDDCNLQFCKAETTLVTSLEPQQRETRPGRARARQVTACRCRRRMDAAGQAGRRIGGRTPRPITVVSREGKVLAMWGPIEPSPKSKRHLCFSILSHLVHFLFRFHLISLLLQEPACTFAGGSSSSCCRTIGDGTECNRTVF